MTDTHQSQSAESDAWKEVGHQFKELGESLAATFQAAWKNEEVRQQAHEMKSGLQSLVQQVGQAIDETVSSPEVRRATDQAVKAGEQAAREARPHLVRALRQVNDELQSSSPAWRLKPPARTRTSLSRRRTRQTPARSRAAPA